MGRSLRYLGTLLFATTVWLLIAGSAGWVSEELANRLFRTVAGSGAVCLLGGFLLGLVGKLGWNRRRGRCVRCGAMTDRGQAYCLDHLLQTVADYRDQNPQRPNLGTRRQAP